MYSPEVCCWIIVACMVLHNYSIDRNFPFDPIIDSTTSDGDKISERDLAHKQSVEGIALRQNLLKYF